MQTFRVHYTRRNTRGIEYPYSTIVHADSPDKARETIRQMCKRQGEPVRIKKVKVVRS